MRPANKSLILKNNGPRDLKKKFNIKKNKWDL